MPKAMNISTAAFAMNARRASLIDTLCGSRFDMELRVIGATIHTRTSMWSWNPPSGARSN